MNGHLIERYRTCTTHEEVEAMQETLQVEMEADNRANRERKGGFHQPDRVQQQLTES